MNRYERQDYYDIDIGDVDQTELDICQLKFDGIWCGADVTKGGNVGYYSRHGECKRTESGCRAEPGLYVGEFMYGSQWARETGRVGNLYVFDIIEHRGVCIKSLPYCERYKIAANNFLAGFRDPNWHMVQNYPTHESLRIWHHLIATGQYEGLVFRNSLNHWHSPLYRAKMNFYRDLYICGFEEGENRLKGSLGAVFATESPLGVGLEHRIGGGFTDKQRRDIWNNKEKYLGKCMEVEAKKVFESGKLRHANFIRFHPDK